MSDSGLFQRSESPDNADELFINPERAASPKEPNIWSDYSTMADFTR